MKVTKTMAKSQIIVEGREIRDDGGVIEQSLEFALPMTVGGDGLKVSIRVRPDESANISVWNPFKKKWYPFVKFVTGD